MWWLLTASGLSTGRAQEPACPGPPLTIPAPPPDAGPGIRRAHRQVSRHVDLPWSERDVRVVSRHEDDVRELGGDVALEALLRQVVCQRIRTRDAPDADLAVAMDGLGTFLAETRRAARQEVQALLEDALTMTVEVHGERSIEAAAVLRHLGVLARVHQDHEAALDLFRRSLDLERALGGDLTHALANVAFTLAALGRSDEARAAVEEALELQGYGDGARTLDIAKLLNTLAGTYEQDGDLARARALQEEGLAIREEVVGPDDPSTAVALNQLGLLLQQMGELDEARARFERALAIREREGTPQEIARMLSNLALLRHDQGDLTEALELHVRALALRESLPGRETDVAISLGALGAEWNTLGVPDRAIPYLERALAIEERVRGPEHRNVAAILNNLSTSYRLQGDLERAVEVQERSLAIREAQYGPNHVQTAVGLNNLGSLLDEMGADERAVEMLERAVSIRETALGPDHPATATALNNLGTAVQQLGELERAQTLFERCLAIRMAALGEGHVETAGVLNNLAVLHHARGDYERGEAYVRRAMASWEAAVGADHPRALNSRNNLGRFVFEQGRTTEAIAIWTEVLAARTARLGPDHPDIAVTHHGLSKAYEVQGDLDRAAHHLRSALTIEEQHLARNLGRGSPSERKAFFQSVTSSERVVSFHLQRSPADRDLAEFALLTLLRRKGRLIDAEADVLEGVRTELGDDGAALLDELSIASSELQLAHARRAEDPDRFALASERWEAASRAIAAKSARFRRESLPVEAAEIAARVPGGALLIEFARWAEYTPQAPPDQRWGAPRYAAYVLDTHGLVTWVDLGPAERIDRSVAEFVELTSERRPSRTAAEVLYRDLLGQLGPLVADARELILAPEGALNVLPFDALVGPEGQPLAADHVVHYVLTGRDLLRLDEVARPAGPPVIVANADFGASSRWPALPGTAREGRAIHAVLTDGRLVEGKEATERFVSALRSPGILHVASHGYFRGAGASAGAARGLVPTAFPAAAADRPIDETAPPLLSSGVVLADADDRSGEGYLSAAEVVRMDLSGTRLVTLSACETGVGTVEPGEGVQGLRRALTLAGAQSQVLSLWRVDDEATAELMASFYSHLGAGRSRAEALAAAKWEIASTDRWRHPYYWAAFTLSGDWRPLPTDGG